MTTGTINRIMVASDLSEWADYAVHRAALLASEHKAQLSLLYVIDEEMSDPGLMELVQKGAKVFVDELSRAVEASLREQATNLAVKHAFEYSIQVEPGKGFVNIIKRARDDNADLIVLGFHGRHYFRDVFLGTTAEKVVRKGDRSVLVVRNQPEEPYNRVLVAVDFSSTSREALEFALSLAPDAELLVLHAYQYPTKESVDEAGGALSSQDYMARLEERAKTELNNFLAGFDIGSRSVEPIVEFGYPPAVIRKVTEKRQVDLALVGARGHTDLRHVMLGSTAEHALRELECDVLVVRAGALSFELP